MTFVFLSWQFKAFEQLCGAIPSDSSMVGIAERQSFETFRDTMIRLGKTENIRSIGSIIARMVEICEEHLQDQSTPR